VRIHDNSKYQIQWLQNDNDSGEKEEYMKRMIACRRGLPAVVPTIVSTVVSVAIAMSVFFLPASGWSACTIFSCGEYALPDDPGKFNGMWWGQYLGELKDMRLASLEPSQYGELYYTRQGDVLQMADVKLDYVQYGFWKGLYSSVAFGTKGVRNWEALRNISFGNFGPWYQPDSRVERYEWVGRNSAMSLWYDFPMGEAQLYVYSKVIYERQLAQARWATGGKKPYQRFWLY